MRLCAALFFVFCFLSEALSAKTVLLLAGTSELGVHIANLLCQEGCDLVIAARNKAKFQQLNSKLRKSYKRAKISYVYMDYADIEKFNVA